MIRLGNISHEPNLLALAAKRPTSAAADGLLPGGRTLESEVGWGTNAKARCVNDPTRDDPNPRIDRRRVVGLTPTLRRVARTLCHLDLEAVEVKAPLGFALPMLQSARLRDAGSDTPSLRELRGV